MKSHGWDGTTLIMDSCLCGQPSTYKHASESVWDVEPFVFVPRSHFYASLNRVCSEKENNYVVLKLSFSGKEFPPPN